MLCVVCVFCVSTFPAVMPFVPFEDPVQCSCSASGEGAAAQHTTEQKKVRSEIWSPCVDTCDAFGGCVGCRRCTRLPDAPMFCGFVFPYPPVRRR